ncbi:putative membrane protein [Hirsutella rhossiliensis]|uniref:Membrane protein n=1 Tax=Hirsutella rhossiliensis TaxID=111463 RepID=A0A9P8MY99_9HYPO|nr:uncharacterized protein HRG_06603 [Hirsutella rhossiliensis]KAH0962501.1 putative membrane protein [Hirsutella rhossiliensis]
MAPLCADPRQVVIALEPPQRQALLQLVRDITSHMISQLETSADELGSVSPEADADEGDNAGAQAPSLPPRQETQDQRQHAADDKEPAGKAAREAQSIQRAAVQHVQEWRDEFLPRLQEVVDVQDSAKIQAERKARRAKYDQQQFDIPEEGEYTTSFGHVQPDESEDVASLRALYHPIPTELASIPAEDRRESLSCILLLLLATGKYSAHSRALILYLASALELPQVFVNREEMEIARSLMESSTADQGQKETMSAEAEAAKRRQQNKISRLWKVGLASVAGATIIGVTGGLAAPLVAGALGGILGGVGLGGVASFLGIFWMNGALVGALFGAYGAKMTGEMMDSYAREVEDFRFIPLQDQEGDTEEAGKHRKKDQEKDQRRLRVTIGINGWLNAEDDVTAPWRVLSPDTEVFALRYEMKTLLALGTALRDLVHSFAWKTLKVQVIKRTVLATLFAALWPIQLLAAASNIDNPFSRASNRSRKAGRLLADALINRVQGERPVVLVGYSLGAAAVHACLESLAERRAFGLVAAAVVIGAPAPSDPAHWRTLRAIVSGKVFNVYSENDMVLGFVYRMHSLKLGVAGLQPILGVDGVENVDLSDRVSGHLRYPELIGEILQRCGFVGVRAAADIEKDDVIRMKEDHADGKPVDLDRPHAPSASGQERDMGDSEAAKELRGLTIISPPEHTQPEGTTEPQPPALPPGHPPAPGAAAEEPFRQKS